MNDLVKNEIELFAFAERAYFRACETSDPDHWMKAALYAQQHRNALRKLDVNKYENYK